MILRRIFGRKTSRRPGGVSFPLPGWEYAGRRDDLHGWRDAHGDLITLHLSDDPFPDSLLASDRMLQDFCRSIAESRQAGLIEVAISHSPAGSAPHMIYKQLWKPAYSYTGMLFVPYVQPVQVWSLVASEHGMTGVREAVITTELFNAGKLTLEEYQNSWARDPYEPDYDAVDRSVLRFVSDDESYDPRFPDHPLSRVRRILPRLLPDARREEGSSEPDW